MMGDAAFDIYCLASLPCFPMGTNGPEKGTGCEPERPSHHENYHVLVERRGFKIVLITAEVNNWIERLAEGIKMRPNR